MEYPETVEPVNLQLRLPVAVTPTWPSLSQK